MPQIFQCLLFKFAQEIRAILKLFLQNGEWKGEEDCWLLPERANLCNLIPVTEPVQLGRMVVLILRPFVWHTGAEPPCVL